MAATWWITRDLRLHDNPALAAALEEADGALTAVFCLDDRLLHGRHASGPRTQFLLESLADLDAGLRERGGGGVVIRRGPPERVLPPGRVHVTADVSPFARMRFERVAAAGVELCAHEGLNIAMTERSYGVFAPFHRAWLREPRRDVLPAPEAIPPGGEAAGAIPTLDELGLTQDVEYPMRGGEREARRRLAEFLSGPVHGYRRGEDILGSPKTSRLSPYLHFGCISAREAEARLPGSDGASAFRRQLGWRDFYHQVLLTHPRNAFEEHQERYRDGALDWPGDEARFDAWRAGRTGFPLVDAGMRQLLREGWMHNRARLVAGSFLTKQLGIDWRRGERHFMRLLIDGDEANNNGNWQWVASVGVDPAPVFKRLYNPARQQERLDPNGTYVRAHVPELANVPDEYLGEPWTMPRDLQEYVGCVIGRDYPAPIVDRKQAREAALERYRAAAGSASGSRTESTSTTGSAGTRADISRL